MVGIRSPFDTNTAPLPSCTSLTGLGAHCTYLAQLFDAERSLPNASCAPSHRWPPGSMAAAARCLNITGEHSLHMLPHCPYEPGLAPKRAIRQGPDAVK